MLAYANSGFYDDTLFHRVIPGFMVQGGGFTSGLVKSTPTFDPIVLESTNGLSNTRGTIAMARTGDPDSATSQFFVNLVDNTFLDYSNSTNPGYAVFGEVISGLSVIDSIATTGTTTVGGYSDVPVTDITISTMQQTLTSSNLTKDGILTVSGLEVDAQWDYSLDNGVSWSVGTGDSLMVPVGSYNAGAIQVRQTDTAGNMSENVGQLDGALTVYLHQMIKVSGTNYLNNISLHYIQDTGDKVGSMVAKNGSITISQSLGFDAVKLSDSSAFTSDIKIGDAIDILRHIVDIKTLDPTSSQFHAADVNNDGTVTISDAIDVLRHIVDIKKIDTFDLIDDQGSRITQLDENSSDGIPEWTLVANGDVDLSGSFAEDYVVAVDMV